VKLSENFKLSEFACGDGCGGEADHVESLRALCVEVLEPLRAALGGVRLDIHSGYRCAAFNVRCGGAKNSQHMRATAADVKSSAGPDAVWAAALKVQRKRGRGGVGRYSRFTHVDNRARRSNWNG
jgi:uncharacterized protein YcbK (DUF882 family)